VLSGRLPYASLPLQVASSIRVNHGGDNFFMSTEAVIIFAVLVLVGMGAIIAFLLYQLVKKVEDVHKAANGFLESTKKSSHAEGMEDQKKLNGKNELEEWIRQRLNEQREAGKKK
jgi:hypothetical protein